MRTQTALAIAVSALFSTIAYGAPPQGDFQPGDLYLVSQALDVGGVAKHGVLRVDPFTGATQLIAQLPFVEKGGTFDPFRHGVVVGGMMQGAPPNTGFLLVKSAGAVTLLGSAVTGSLLSASAVGDGRIYFLSASDSNVHYLDAANVVHDVLDPSGAAPYVFLNGSFGATQIYYHAASNALFFGTLGSSAPCPNTTGNVAYVFKALLSGDGTQVIGVPFGSPVCVAGGSSGFEPNSLSAGPGTSLFLTVDDNSNNALARLVTISPTTLVASPFATNGPYNGAAATNAGVYSHLFNRGVILDTGNDKLRLFKPGESGAGVTFLTGNGLSEIGSSGEPVTMIEIPASASTGSGGYGTGTAGCNGPQILSASVTPKVGAPNFRFLCTNVPNPGTGLLLVGNAPDLAGSDPFAFGILFHVNLFASTFLDGLDAASNGFGIGGSPAPIPLAPSFVGQTIFAQSIWLWSGCTTPSPLGLSSSNGLAVTFQP